MKWSNVPLKTDRNLFELLGKKISNRSAAPNNCPTFALLNSLWEDLVALREKNYPTIGKILLLSSASQRLGEFWEATRGSKINDVVYKYIYIEQGGREVLKYCGQRERLEDESWEWHILMDIAIPSSISILSILSVQHLCLSVCVYLWVILIIWLIVQYVQYWMFVFVFVSTWLIVEWVHYVQY